MNNNIIRITSMSYFEPESGPHIAVIYSVYDEDGTIISQNNRWDKALFDTKLIETFRDARDVFKAKIAEVISNE